MDFCIQLSADYPDKSYGGDRVYSDMLEQARLADRVGFESVSLTEHHLINVLMNPAPLQFAVRIAAETTNLKIITSVVVLPLHDMRVFAGEIVVADILTDQRLLLGVGRGAYKFEMERLGVPIIETQARFDEAVAVLQALLTQEEVSWDGHYYQFEPLTIMPRPVRPGGPPMMVAVLDPAKVYSYAKQGMHIQTTPLAGNKKLLQNQVNQFRRAQTERYEDGEEISLTLSRIAFVSSSRPTHQRKLLETAHAYYKRFDNVFTGPGIVDAGMIRPLPRTQSIDELAENVLICSSSEMVDKLALYSELGVDRMVFNINFGVSQTETLECIQRMSEEVLPHFM